MPDALSYQVFKYLKPSSSNCSFLAFVSLYTFSSKRTQVCYWKHLLEGFSSVHRFKSLGSDLDLAVRRLPLIQSISDKGSG